jgi:lysophospholipase L1-like esterase
MPGPTRRQALALLANACLGTSLVSSLARISAAHAAAPERLATQPIDRLNLPWWRHRFEEKQERLREGHVDFLFIGDSIIQQFEFNDPTNIRGNYAPVWEHFYGRRNAVNLGFIGDTTASLIWRLRNGELDHIAPRVAVLLIGANNYGAVHWGAEPTLAGISVCLDELRRRLPATHVILLSVLPSDRGPWVTEQTIATNRGLAERYGSPRANLTFIDVTKLFTLPNGEVDPAKFIDPMLRPPEHALHPNPAAMAALCTAIEPTVARLIPG